MNALKLPHLRNLWLFLLLVVATVALLNGTQTYAADKRSKVIDFEDEVVEGVNKRPLDSLSQISEKDKKRRKPHLYRKRAGFRAETREVVRELRYVQ